MVDDVKDITETAESKVSSEALDRARLARERRESEQRRRLEELRAHAAAAQAQREKRDEDRRRRQAEARARDDDRRVQVEERKRAIWEASISRREALLQREREREQRLERSRAARSAPRPAFAFGSSTPRLLEPVDTAGFFWAARRAASTTNVMFASAPLTRRASALQLDSEIDNKDEPERSPQAMAWSSVARRRTDLVPTLPAARPGRASSMTRLDRVGASSRQSLLQTKSASGASTPASRPGSAMSNCNSNSTVVRRTTPRRPRPASIAGTGVNTPRGAGDGVQALSSATTPSVSRDASSGNMAAGDAPRRPPPATPRRPRPASMHAAPTLTPSTPGDGKPPLHRKPKLSKEQEKANRNKSLSVSPGRSAPASKEPSVDKELVIKKSSSTKSVDKSVVSATEVSQKLAALQIASDHNQNLDSKENENKEQVEVKSETKVEPVSIEQNKQNEKEQKQEKQEEKKIEKQEEKKIEKQEEKKIEREEKKDAEKADESEMTGSMTASMRRITTEEEAKAALAERRRKAREELERQAELERQRLQREAEEEEERQRQEREREKREEEEARELARLQRQMDEEKLRRAIEAQQQLEREEAERKAREEQDKLIRLKEEEEKRKALEEELRLKREEAEREEKERIARKQRVEAIMARTRLRKAEEDKKQQESKPPQSDSPAPVVPQSNGNKPADNGNATTADLLGLGGASNGDESKPSDATDGESQQQERPRNNGNVTADLLGLSEQHNTEDKIQEQPPAKQNDNAPTNVPTETNNGNVGHTDPANVGHISANFIQTERLSGEQQKLDPFNEDDFTTHNGHGQTINHPLKLQNAI
ncbi:MAP7 domain-containing protein 1 isoform X3 [Plutella xylostella]|uniref:MAP7 domain-containing protein 1 isoform X3 n=1 Tax=Plutella xylostella TaxID=51655 RepID=UPI0020325399|nr:MAP7 domain-containing protein 1 isoform X3 [Plutella xylostella]